MPRLDAAFSFPSAKLSRISLAFINTTHGKNINVQRTTRNYRKIYRARQEPSRCLCVFFKCKKLRIWRGFEEYSKRKRWFLDRRDTPFGPAKISLRDDKDQGVLDHDFFVADGGGEWTVFCRVMPNERGSTVSWTFISLKHYRWNSLKFN